MLTILPDDVLALCDLRHSHHIWVGSPLDFQLYVIDYFEVRDVERCIVDVVLVEVGAKGVAV